MSGTAWLIKVLQDVLDEHGDLPVLGATGEVFDLLVEDINGVKWVDLMEADSSE